ncbi:30S ribosomal protein S9 [uncultured Sanguibacteroides sp.]|uniref:30S ribosomal protein S9 n=1 Tax=uncultured Sanguibacteroides sp. TaxID=1635151 RepID=UPI0025F4516B|nr:30S ribosomal protein S9 [uncultured Sanguibacteroides sp.]
MEVINAIGRRKTAVARVYLSEGKGNITINKRNLEEYFTLPTLQYIVKQPLELLGVTGQYDIKVNLDGGGFNGQAEALRLGIARALVKINAEDKSKLRAAGFMTRDPREVERKKPGRPGARKRFQFSKR